MFFIEHCSPGCDLGTSYNAITSKSNSQVSGKPRNRKKGSSPTSNNNETASQPTKDQNAIRLTDISKTSKGTSKQKLNRAKLNTKTNSKHCPINGVDVLVIPSGSEYSQISLSIEVQNKDDSFSSFS